MKGAGDWLNGGAERVKRVAHLQALMFERLRAELVKKIGARDNDMDADIRDMVQVAVREYGVGHAAAVAEQRAILVRAFKRRASWGVS